METFSPKIELINYFDDLIKRVDIEIEECLEKHQEEELLDQKTQIVENKKLGSDLKFIIDSIDIDSLEEKEDELWPESIKIVDYLNQIRMRTIEELRNEQKDSVENSSKFNHLKVSITDQKKKEELKIQLFSDKFCFLVKITRQEFTKRLFNTFTFVTDFFMPQSDIDLLEKLINSDRINIKRLFRDYKLLFDEKMVLIGLLYKCFWDNITTQKFPNQVIHVNKDLLSKKRIDFKNLIIGVNLKGPSNYLSEINHLQLDILHGKLEEVNIENLRSLEYFSLRSISVKRITLKSLDALKILILDLSNQKSNNLQTDLLDQIPNIEQLIVINYCLRFSFNKSMFEKTLLISNLSNKDIDYDSIYTFRHQIDKIEIIDSLIENTKVFSGFDKFTNVFELDLYDSFISQIEKKMLDGLRNLRSLSLRYNLNLEIIDFDAFSNLKLLVNLDLSYNKIESLDNRTFSELVNLETLNLSWNRIKSLDENIFSNLKSLRELDLRFNELERIDHKLFIGLVTLFELKLSVNKLEYFDLRIFDLLPQMKVIEESGIQFKI